MSDLKLIAFDAEDLSIMSMHLQDAVVRVGDMALLARERRFALLANRFDWAEASSKPRSAGALSFVRRRSALRFERVLEAKVQGIDLKAPRQVLSLLALRFEATAPEDPAGQITLLFAGNAAIRLTVECIEAELRDLGAAWSAKARGKPTHPDDGTT